MGSFGVDVKRIIVNFVAADGPMHAARIGFFWVERGNNAYVCGLAASRNGGHGSKEDGVRALFDVAKLLGY